MPERVRMSRAKGWRLPGGAVYVGRPTRWGNPFRVGQDGLRFVGTVDGDAGRYGERAPVVADISVPVPLPADLAVALYRRELEYALSYEGLRAEDVEDRERVDELRSALAALAGRDLACWCPLDQVCHADVLLDLANG